ncbi:MAG: putative acyltransferase [Glaciihabitans sp.]|nr:putative acyltransferase [Glaciihabitans sp.]
MTRQELATGTSRSESFRPDIQGLRAVAVVLVVLYHAGLPYIPGGYVGVDVFFVISGYLITGHLAKSLVETGTIRFGDFYARRARRILPAAFTVLAATILASVVFASPFRIGSILRDGMATALYVPNLYFAAQRTDYLADAAPSPFQHYWSLGVEEQFYLLWPVLLWLLFTLVRRHHSRRVGAVVVVVVLSFGACLLVAPISQPWAFFSLPTRAWELGIGALVALISNQTERVPSAIGSGAAWIGGAAIVWSAFAFDAETQYPGATTAIPVLGAALFIAGGSAGRFGPAKALAWTPIQCLGKISYSLYLVHWPLLVLANARSDVGLPLAMRLTLVAVAVPVAWLLFRFVETPLRYSSHQRQRHPRSILWTAAAISTAMAATFLFAGPAVATLPTASDKIAANSALQTDPKGTGYVPSNLEPTLRSAIGDTGVLYTDGCQQTISSSKLVVCRFGDIHSKFRMVLFGDSHAGRWFPAIKAVAESEHIRLETYTKSACKSEDVDRRWPGPAGSTCAQWRQEAIAALNKNPPNLIVLINHLGLSTASDTSSETAEWETGIEHSIDRLPPASQILTIADTPEFDSAPAACLSTHLGDASACAGPLGQVLNAQIAAAQSAVAARTGAAYLDLNSYFCNAQKCPAIIGSTLVYADEHHLTATFTRRLAGPLDAALKRYLPSP